MSFPLAPHANAHARMSSSALSERLERLCRIQEDLQSCTSLPRDEQESDALSLLAESCAREAAAAGLAALCVMAACCEGQNWAARGFHTLLGVEATHGPRVLLASVAQTLEDASDAAPSDDGMLGDAQETAAICERILLSEVSSLPFVVGFFDLAGRWLGGVAQPASLLFCARSRVVAQAVVDDEVTQQRCLEALLERSADQLARELADLGLLQTASPLRAVMLGVANASNDATATARCFSSLGAMLPPSAAIGAVTELRAALQDAARAIR